MSGVKIKSTRDILIMKEGGRKLAKIKNALAEEVKDGVKASDIEALATELIAKSGGQPSFKMVPGYSWSTCVNVNDGLVHGIPTKNIVFKKGDIVSVDVGLFYGGFHTDTSISLLIGKDNFKEKFLSVGKHALRKAIQQAKAGRKIGDISRVIEKTIEKGGYYPIRALVGHGVGRELHEYPPIACFTTGAREELIKIENGFVLAIEVMYADGGQDVVLDEDGWTIRTKNGKISALFEETVAMTPRGSLVLTV